MNVTFSRKAALAGRAGGLFGLLLGLGMLAGQSAWADSEAGTALTRDIPAFKDFEQQGGVVEYIGRRGSLDGYALITKDRDLKTVYVTPERTMVMGILVDETGANLTAGQLQAYQQRLTGDQSALPGADGGAAPKAEQVYAAAEKAGWAQVGASDAPYIYMFLNVNCEHCQAMFRDLQPALRAQQLQVRLVPYGVADANRDGGAALLSVADPGAAWLAYMNGDKTALSADKIAKGAVEKIAGNTALVNDRKIQGPPFALYRRPSDGVVTGLIGRPRNAMALVSDLMPLDPPAPVPQGEDAP